jgi:mannosyl-3-phosphoglycerate phosphatase
LGQQNTIRSDRAPKVVIFTDLDGTFLGHNDFDIGLAGQRLAELTAAGVLVVFNTSKTLIECRALLEHLDQALPVIVENGSAIVVPERVSRERWYRVPKGSRALEEGWKVTWSIEVQLSDLQRFKASYLNSATDFLSCERAFAEQLSGLSGYALDNARARQHSLPLEPVMIEPSLIAKASDYGFQFIQGGRFLSLQGQTDKGQAMKIFLDHLQSDTSVWTVAMGDSKNDEPMLAHADLAIVVKRDHKHLAFRRASNVFTTQCSAPNGWVEGVDRAMEQLLGRSLVGALDPDTKNKETINGR